MRLSRENEAAGLIQSALDTGQVVVAEPHRVVIRRGTTDLIFVQRGNWLLSLLNTYGSVESVTGYGCNEHGLILDSETAGRLAALAAGA